MLALGGGVSPSLPSLEIAFFAPGGGDAPVLFATCGASQVVMKDGRRMEGIFMLRPRPTLEGAEAVARLLGSLALYAERQGVAIGVGDVIPARDDLASISNLDAIVLMPPVSFVPAFRRIEWRDRAAEVLWALPVYQEEASYALEHGPEALLTLFAAQGLDLSRMDRDQANTLLLPEDAKVLAETKDKERAAAPKLAPQAPAPRRGLASTGVGAGMTEDADGFVVEVKPPKPKKPRPVKAPEPAGVEEPAAPPPKQRARPAPPSSKAKKFDLNKGRAAVFAPRDDDREQLRAPQEPEPEPPQEESEAEAKKKRVEALKAAAKERAAKAKGE